MYTITKNVLVPLLDNNLSEVHALVERMIKLEVLVFFIDLLALGASRKTLLGWRISIIHLIWFKSCIDGGKKIKIKNCIRSSFVVLAFTYHSFIDQ